MIIMSPLPLSSERYLIQSSNSLFPLFLILYVCLMIYAVVGDLAIG